MTPLNEFRQSNQTQLSARSNALRVRLFYLSSTSRVFLSFFRLSISNEQTAKSAVTVNATVCQAVLPTRGGNLFLIKSSKQKPRHAIHSSANIPIPRSTIYSLVLCFSNSIVFATLKKSKVFT